MEKKRISTTTTRDEFEDEEKMDQFYDLIRRFNEARDDHQRTLMQLRLHHHHDHQPDKPINQKNNNEINGVGSATTWMPSFKWEDFRDVHHHHQDQDHHQDQEQEEQVVVSEKSTAYFLNQASNCVNCIMNNNRFKKLDNKSKKKRKINDVVDDDDDDDDGEITTADQLLDTGLDLNLAL